MLTKRCLFSRMSSRKVEQGQSPNIFVEQAEYIGDNELTSWSATHPDEQNILSKLTQGGAKLITGPRGAGKTTLLLKAHHQMLSDKGPSLSVYVNYKASLRLEPLYKRHSNAVFLFNQWLLLKAYDGLIVTAEKLGVCKKVKFKYSAQQIEGVLGRLEVGDVEIEQREVDTLTIPFLEQEIQMVLDATGKSRCVLLLDDAAHAFSPDQQKDFFDFFRRIKSRCVAPKAAIYPGVTVYSSAFHVGHDAEEVDVWIRPDNSLYEGFMKGVLEKRLNPSLWADLAHNEPLLCLLCYAAFGMPRSLINMVRMLVQDQGQLGTSTVTRARVLKAIHQNNQSIFALFSSLSSKLPMYANFITEGSKLYQRMVELIKEYNRTKDVLHQSVIAAIRQPIPTELSKVFGFFQYSGLLLPKGEVSRGEKGTFDLFVIHYSAFIDSNALFGRKALNVNDYVTAFRHRDPHEFTRIGQSKLLERENPEDLFALSLPPCQKCQTPRSSEHAKFCQNCGAPLLEASIFEALVEKDISSLRLTERRVTTIKSHSNIRKIRDILMDHDHSELRGVPQIGPFWSKHISSLAEEYIA